MKKKKTKLNSCTEEDMNEVHQWILQNNGQVPDAVLKALDNYQTISHELRNNQSKRSTLLIELRRALGLVPSSERKKLRSQKTQEDKRTALVQDKEFYHGRAQWHSNQAKKHRTMEKDIEKKIKSIDDVVLTPEDLAETEKYALKVRDILESGGEPEASLVTPKEALMTGIDAQVVTEEVDLHLPELPSNEEYKNTFYETRTRYDFDVQVAEIKVNVEKGQNAAGRIVSASTHDLGPKKFQVTWGFLANVALLVTQYAIPFERLARLTSTSDKKFSSSHMCRFFSYVANRLLPIYLHLGKNLAKSDLLSGDDTTVRVLEAKASVHEEDQKPWGHYATMENAETTLSQFPDLSELGPKLALELGFEFPKKSGDGSKKQLKTTVVIGKSDKSPESHIVFYRTHFGNFGNLLDVLLLQRSSHKKDILIQSDLSTVNLISDPLIMNNFIITQFGCAAHARRPFALHEDADPLCSFILSLFRNIYHMENSLNVWGRNMTNVTQIRQQVVLKDWEEILRLCNKLTIRWSAATAVGIGARYVIKHYEKLIAYIKNPFVPLTNDLSERMLRMEKIIQVNSLFRNSLEGRFALDICRTIVQTAIAADVNVKDYLLYVLKQNDLQHNVAQFTPLAFARNQPESA